MSKWSECAHASGVWRVCVRSGNEWRIHARDHFRRFPALAQACAPRTPGVCPPWEGREKFQQRIKTPYWHPQEAVVQSPSPLVFRGAAVSSKMLRVRLLPATFQDTAHLTSPPSKRSVKTSAPFREAGSVESTAKYISVGRRDCRERLQDSLCISASAFQQAWSPLPWNWNECICWHSSCKLCWTKGP